MDANTLILYLVMALVLGLVLGLAIILVWSKLIIPRLWDYRIVLKRVTNTRTITTTTRGKVKYHKNAPNKFKLLGGYKHLKVPIPPDKCTDVTKQGRKFALGYIIDDDQVIWVEDQTLIDKEDLISKTEPITQEQRALYLEQYKKAEARKPMSWATILAAAAPGAMILIIFVMAFAFWEDITSPMLEAQKQTEEMQKNQLDMIQETTKLAKALQGIEVIEEDPNINLDEPPLFEGGGP